MTEGLRPAPIRLSVLPFPAVVAPFRQHMCSKSWKDRGATTVERWGGGGCEVSLQYHNRVFIQPWPNHGQLLQLGLEDAAVALCRHRAGIFLQGPQGRTGPMVVSRAPERGYYKPQAQDLHKPAR